MRTRIRTLTASQSRRRAATIGAMAMAVVAGAAALALTNRSPALDERSLCPTDRKLETSFIILVDTTDSLTQVQISRLLANVREVRDSLPTYGKLTLLFLDATTPFEPKELVSLCNPGSPRNVNRLFQTESRIRKRWEGSFEKPVERATAALATAPTASRSPIIQAIAASTWRPDFDARVTTRSLLIVSDLLQHDSSYSQYTNRSRDIWASYARSSLVSEAIANLSHVNVQVEYLRRPKDARYQGEMHRAFWYRWFQEAGASSIDFVGLPNPETPSKIPMVADRRVSKS
jgi:hypothetical protein